VISQKEVKIQNRMVGEGHPVFIIAEIGINHNGDIKIAKKLIEIAAAAGCDAVKFQKRTTDLVYSKEELEKPRESPWGTTVRQQKERLEFSVEQYAEVSKFCKEQEILWFASCWDTKSIDDIDSLNPPCYKIASASLTDDELLKATRAKGKPILLSTGMSTMEEIGHAVEVLGKRDLIIMHCTSSYPAKPEELNLRLIPQLREWYGIPIGYSGHEVGILPSVIAAQLGACVVERHITLDRAMYGSDQAASIEPPGLVRLVRDIRMLGIMMGDGEKKVYETEVSMLKKLRKVKIPESVL